MSAQSSAHLAQIYTQAIIEGERMLIDFDSRSKVFIDNYIESALRGDPDYGSEDLTPLSTQLIARSPTFYRELLFTSQDAGVRRLWQQTRIVYDIDPSLWTMLGETDHGDIPTEIFQYLPHPNPFIAFPEPIKLQVNENAFQMVRGVFIVGRNTSTLYKVNDINEYYQTSTHDPQSIGFGMVFPGEMYDASGKMIYVDDKRKTQDMIWTRIGLDCDRDTKTVNTQWLIQKVTDRFIPVKVTQGNNEEWKTHIAVLLSRAVNLLVYLCTTNVDLVPLYYRPEGKRRSPPGSKNGKTKNVPTPKTFGIGYRVGKAFKAHLQATSSGHRNHTGRTQTPHVRRAHFHTYRVGVGRQETTIKWLSPIMVNVDKEIEQSTVIRVSR